MNEYASHAQARHDAIPRAEPFMISTRMSHGLAVSNGHAAINDCRNRVYPDPDDFAVNVARRRHRRLA